MMGAAVTRLAKVPGRGRGRFLVLPGLLILATGAAAGPTLWQMGYAALRRYCLTPLAQVEVAQLALFTFGLLAGVSLVSALFFVARQTLLTRRLNRSVAAGRHDTAERLAGLQQRHGLRPDILCVRDEESRAFCHGLSHPKIVLSSGLANALSDAEMEAVLLHEAAHVRRRDPLKIFLWGLLASAFFYIPLAHWLQERCLLCMEVAADREAVTEVGAPSLAAAMLKMVQAGGARRLPAAAATMGPPTEQRVRYLLEPWRGMPSILPSRAEVFANGLLLGSSGLLAGGFAVGVNRLVSSGIFCNLRM